MVRIAEPDPRDAVNDETERWLDEIQPRLVNLEDFQDLPDDFPFDLSVASLRRLEAVVVERVAERREADDAFVLGVVAYLGEALMRVAGGQWEGGGLNAVVRPDPALELAPVSPPQLLDSACAQGTGQVFDAAAAQLVAAVQAKHAEAADWEPTKIRTLSVDEIF